MPILMKQNHKRLIDNIFSLSLLNCINMLMPLVTLPYLVKVIGLSNYGAYSIVMAIVQYIILFSSYGFNFSTTKQISQNRENLSFVNSVFNATIIARCIISMISIIIIIFISCAFIPKSYLLMLIYGLGMVMGDILNPVWLFQGMEKMRFMTVVNFIAKVSFTGLIFICIRTPEDSIYVTLFNSIGYIVAGVISYIFACRYFKLRPEMPTLRAIQQQLRDGGYIFLSIVSMNLYRNSNVLILGFFLNDALVGLYAGAEKIIKAAQSITTPISNALFPYVAKFFKDSAFNQKIRQIKRLSLLMTIPLTVITIMVGVFAPLANRVLLDNVDYKAIELIRIMSPVILVGGLNYILGIVGLVNIGAQRRFFKYVTISGIGSLLFMLISVHWLGVYSAAIAMALTEYILFVFCVYQFMLLHKCSH